MKNAKRVIIPVVIVLVVLLALNSCKDTLGAVIDQATGKADTVQEEDTTQWAELTSDPLSLEGIGDPIRVSLAASRQQLPEHRLQRHLEPPDRLLHGPQRRHHPHRLRHRRGHPEV